MQGEFQYSTPRKYVMSTKRNLFFQETFPESSGIADADYVGYANIQQQLYRKAVRRGFEFTLMVVGESGLGKSTFINNLFLSDVYGPDHPGPSQRIKKTIQLEETNVHLIENGIHLYLTVIDVPGFGDSVNNSGCWLPIVNLIEEKHQQHLDAENKHYRGFIVDTRIHCCMYFISPWGYGLKPLDIEVLRNLHKRVNIVPVIAKADAFTAEELLIFKENVMKQIEENDIKIYGFHSYETGDDVTSLKNQLPFAVMGSLLDFDSDERLRKYPWGKAVVENPDHCDFIALRNLLVRTHMHSLKISTKLFYELYRYKTMSERTEEEKYYLMKIEEEKRAHGLKLKQQAEEMENIFNAKIAEKLAKLKQAEAELENRSRQMADSLEQERQDLEKIRAELEEQKAQNSKFKCVCP